MQISVLSSNTTATFHFVISYIVLIKILCLSPLADVSGVEGVCSLHVVKRQAGYILNAASWSTFYTPVAS